MGVELPKDIRPTEFQEQHSLCEYVSVQYPKVVFFSDLSGVWLPKGVARKIKGLKSSRGIPDFILLEPRGKYHGLILELKRFNVNVYKRDGSLKKNKHLEEQAKVLTELQEKGYAVKFCSGFEEAKKLVDFYMTKM